MNKVNSFLMMFVCAALFTACTNEINEWQEQDNLQSLSSTRATATTISLAQELDAVTLNAANGTATVGGFYWNQTYSNTKFTTPNFTFSHTSTPEWNYWDGFTLSNVADTHNYGVPGDPGNPAHSEGWLPHQWGCMAVPTGTNQKPNFLVGYWGYYMLDYQHKTELTFNETWFSNWVKLGNDANGRNVSTIKVAMHPWPYYGILNGDGFARKFEQGKDHFDLIVYGVKANGDFITESETDNQGNTITVRKGITYKMADYTGSSFIMSAGWINIPINFEEPVKYLVFQMFTTDSHPIYGPNSAVYFCLRDIVMQ